MSINKVIIMVLLGVIMLVSCKHQKQVVYLEYSSVRNTIEVYEHLNDSTLLIGSISGDPTYGRIPEKPLFMGLADVYEGGRNREKFFNALIGLNGEEITARRYKSCCPFKTLNSRTVGADQKFGLLDIWIVSTEGRAIDTLYVNPYDEGELIAPSGYLIKN
jgi:hypothetical protein